MPAITRRGDLEAPHLGCGIPSRLGAVRTVFATKKPISCHLFPIRIKENSPIQRDEIIQHLIQRNIDTRLLFGGNLIKQPLYENSNFRKVGNLINTSTVMNNAFWIGVYPRLTHQELDFMTDKIRDFIN